ncbi:hypothetical protein M427DRAFT_31208 [Gonapodya prolifera JEL478]|uniref:Uncharacterized protein n=1 Tax=Gonapodya prolifera (strain JEL478) TaxID=1344416 RepID=A0A139AI56_GONPJ|nr:hypothetical protein M427DRAFT_31208 [Gonapodya prolifera JEL478]|eukprot:KXS16492.1 hypothetical protein M427DRAFT_31208 [Gonapodya prolifera JEL478]
METRENGYKLRIIDFYKNFWNAQSKELDIYPDHRTKAINQGKHDLQQLLFSNDPEPNPMFIPDKSAEPREIAIHRKVLGVLFASDLGKALAMFCLPTQDIAASFSSAAPAIGEARGGIFAQRRRKVVARADRLYGALVAASWWRKLNCDNTVFKSALCDLHFLVEEIFGSKSESGGSWNDDNDEYCPGDNEDDGPHDHVEDDDKDRNEAADEDENKASIRKMTSEGAGGLMRTNQAVRMKARTMTTRATTRARIFNLTVTMRTGVA